MKQYDFDFRGSLKIDGAEEHLMDKVCEIFNSNVKEIETKSCVEPFYSNFVVVLENQKELDCEISWNEAEDSWDGTIFEV